MARAMAAMPDTSPRLKAALGKWPGMFARVALVFHLIEAADAIANEEAGPFLMVIPKLLRDGGGVHLDIVLPHMLRAHAVMFSTAQTGHAQWIAGYILAKSLDRITTRDVVRGLPRVAGARTGGGTSRHHGVADRDQLAGTRTTQQPRQASIRMDSQPRCARGVCEQSSA